MQIRNTSATLSGPGPFVLDAQTTDTTIFAPGANVQASAVLPDMTQFADGVDLTFVVAGSALGTTSVTLTPVAGQTAGEFGALVLREGGSVTLRADQGAAHWNVIAQVTSVPGPLSLFVSTAGDDNNPGTAALPLRTVDAAVARATATSWSGAGHVNIAAGTYLLGANVMTTPCAGSVGGEPLCLIGALVDSGLGTRAIASSAVGNFVTVTYGTVRDSVGGFTANAFRDFWLRLTGTGAQVGKRFLITGNTTDTFTIAGLFVAVTTETFVVEQPATMLQWPLKDAILYLAAGIGMQNVRLDGQGAGSAMRLRGGGVFYHAGCQFRDWGSINLEDSQLTTIIASVFSNSFPSIGTLNTVGSSFVSSAAGAVVSGSRGGGVDYQNCLVRMRTNFANGVVQTTLTAHQGDAGVRIAGGGNLALGAPWFDGVTALAGDKSGAAAAIVVDGGTALFQNARVDSCTGAALTLNDGDAKVQGLQGAGNTGVPVRLFVGAALRQSLANSVTGTVLGDDVQVGGNALPSAWAAVNAGLVNDLAAASSQLCVASS